MSNRSPLEINDQKLVTGVLGRQARAIAKTITLVESVKPEHQERAQAVLEQLLPHTGKGIRVGISGVPGAGKSTFIEALGLYLIGQGHRVAVLAVDPSSSVTGGSILGDKTRMERLCQERDAYIRPSPSAGSLGGVADRTREAMLVCEAAGFDVVIVETVGVGQSETTVAGMVDVFVLLQLPNAGDDLQAIKKGIVELADLVLFNKTDLDPKAAEMAMHQMKGALTMLRPHGAPWHPPVLGLSALKGLGVKEFWAEIERFSKVMGENGEWWKKRQHQSMAWMWTLIDMGLKNRFRQHPGVQGSLPDVSRSVEQGSITPAAAAHRLLGMMNRFF